jgi:hypothetical protein
MSNPDRPGYRPGGVTGKGFLPGQSGNPGGRPKGRTLTGILRDLLDREHNGRAVVELLAERILKEALTGKFPFAKELWDRVEERVTERLQVEVDARSPASARPFINIVRREPALNPNDPRNRVPEAPPPDEP